MSDFRLGNPPPLETPGAQYPSYQEHESQSMEEEATGFHWFSYFIRWVVFLGILLGLVYFGWVFLKVEPTPLPQALPVRDHEKIIGRKGGEVKLSDGASIVIPKGALDRDILVSIEKVAEGRVTDLYHLQPDFLKFIKPVLVSLPFHAENLSLEETPFEIKLYTGETKNRLLTSRATSVNPLDKVVRTELMEF